VREKKRRVNVLKRKRRYLRKEEGINNRTKEDRKKGNVYVRRMRL
jgi:hypothetical protein